jgi:hypothetical protein
MGRLSIVYHGLYSRSAGQQVSRVSRSAGLGLPIAEPNSVKWCSTNRVACGGFYSQEVRAELRAWFEAEPWRTSRELLGRLPTERVTLPSRGRRLRAAIAAIIYAVAKVLFFHEPKGHIKTDLIAPTPERMRRDALGK